MTRCAEALAFVGMGTHMKAQSRGKGGQIFTLHMFLQKLSGMLI